MAAHDERGVCGNARGLCYNEEEQHVETRAGELHVHEKRGRRGEEEEEEEVRCRSCCEVVENVHGVLCGGSGARHQEEGEKDEYAM